MLSYTKIVHHQFFTNYFFFTTLTIGIYICIKLYYNLSYNTVGILLCHILLPHVHSHDYEMFTQNILIVKSH